MRGRPKNAVFAANGAETNSVASVREPTAQASWLLPSARPGMRGPLGSYVQRRPDVLNEIVRKLVARDAQGLPAGWKISSKANINFGPEDAFITIGTCPIPREKDTTLVDFEQPRLDIWVWNEDYIQPIQKSRLARTKAQTYVARVDLNGNGQLTVRDHATGQVIYVWTFSTLFQEYMQYEEAKTLYGVYGAAQTLFALPSSLVAPFTISVIPAITACVTKRNHLGAMRVENSASDEIDAVAPEPNAKTSLPSFPVR